MLKYETPVVFDIIMKMSPPSHYKEPPYLLVKTICESSNDPAFQKKKYFRYLEEYARLGLCCKRPKRLTPERKVYYERIRQKKMQAFMEANKERIKWLMKTDINGHWITPTPIEIDHL